MAQGVTRLKELLFDSEQRELNDVTKRVEELYERTGSQERLKSSVANVLDGAMRQAEVERHDHLAEAMAPVVVQTIKNEIRNSRDEMVEVLYPITGRLVASYVANAFKELMDKINARLESGFSLHNLSLKLRSKVTGQPMAELALAGIQHLDVEELYLIRRGSGEMIDRWIKPSLNGSALPQPDELIRGSNRDLHVAGFLAAINDFASDAFDANRSGLQTLEMQTHRVYLRASPSYLLAAKCTGPAQIGAERQLDTAFREALDRHKDILAGPPVGTRAILPPDGVARQADGPARQKDQLRGILSELAGSLQTRLSETSQAGPAKPTSSRKFLWFLGLLAAGLVAWWLWLTYGSMQVAALRRAAEMVVSSSQTFKGWPVTVEAAPDAATVSLSGLAPSEDAKTDLLGAVGRTVAPAIVKDELSVVHSAPPGQEARLGILALRRDVAEIETQVMQSAVGRAVQRAERRLTLALADLGRLEREPGRLQRQSLGAARGLAEQAKEQIVRLQRLLGAKGLRQDDVRQLSEPMLDVAAKLSRAEAELALASGARRDGQPAAGEVAGAPAFEPAHAAEETAFAAERLADLTTALERAASLERRLATSDRQRLESWTKANAVFFANDLDYRDGGRVDALLDELNGLLQGNALRLRVVGYTDGMGQPGRNTSIAANRAEKVAAALTQRGIPRSRLAVIGRVNGPDLSPDLGPDSPNRRVEFELAFEGERAGAGGP